MNTPPVFWALYGFVFLIFLFYQYMVFYAFINILVWYIIVAYRFLIEKTTGISKEYNVPPAVARDFDAIPFILRNTLIIASLGLSILIVEHYYKRK